MKLSGAVTALVGDYRHEPGANLIDFSRTNTYRQFVEAAEQAGFTGPDMEMDSEFSDRSTEWVEKTDDAALQRWVHTIIRCDRSNSDHPTAIRDACSGGHLTVVVRRLGMEEAKPAQ
ncbi:hypothetical protein FDX19_02615 [Citrobacter sp. wls619]|uniref:hypothetical protein n=1 Tax=Citrobacter sp. wls619 TaxID=2576432 RepID=UPI0010C97167|nr:hypothetical protein [Citrobacter sp. wls619]TKV13248.1 hypothetical protein FDX19_02615 [Citrobacter sp. wls619]